MSLAEYPNLSKAFKYADDVLCGNILACKLVILACERFKRDLEDTRFEFDYEEAERVCNLIQKFPHIKGDLANKPMILEPWQLFVYANVFGFKWRHSGLRRFIKVYLCVARKNGKTALSSPLGLYMMALDNEEGAEVYSLASKKDQSRIVFDSAREQAKRTQSFLNKKGVEVFRHHIEQSDSASTYKPLSSDTDSADGLNPHLVILDEVHAFKDRNMYGVMETAIGARSQPLLWAITTAGFDTTGICYELQVDLEKVLKREYDDETQFGMIYTLDPNDDFRDESLWIKANPNLGVSVKHDYLRGMVNKAIRQPANKNNVLTKHFNIWCSATEQFFSIDKWRELADPELDESRFYKKSCYVGLDLASKIDLTAKVKIFYEDGIYYIFEDIWLPEAAIENSHNSSYPAWVEANHLTKTKGEAINLDTIQESLVQDSKKFRISEAMYDPWNATQLAQNMIKSRIEMTEFRMTVANLSEPMKQLEALIREGKIKHKGNPVTAWCLSNVVAKIDHNDNVFPRKTHEKFKIDVAVAIIMALAPWIQNDKKETVYRTRGIRSI
jgi:phage terminase large subunit-like protein